MKIEATIQQTLIWMATVCCLFAGLYIAIDHTIYFFAANNYLISPVQDEAVDAATVVYPILTGKKSFSKIFEHFADHRVVIARLQEMFDFIFTRGVQVIQPYRLAVLLWTNALLFIGFILLTNRQLLLNAKLILAGVYLSMVFAGTSINTYSSTMQITWPYILLFSFLAFYFTAKYCQTHSWPWMLPVFISVNLALYTFNIGLVVLPVIFVVLIKERSLRLHWPAWLGLTIATYGLYFSDGWYTASGGQGIQMLIHHPHEMLLYVSRILSIPLIANAFTTASVQTVMIASFILGFSSLFLFAFLRKEHWTIADTLLFSLMLYSLLCVCAIATTRFWSSFEGPLVGPRFTTMGFVLIACMLTSFFYQWHHQTRTIHKASMSMATMVWLIAFFLPNDANTWRWYDLGLANQYSVASSLDIPLNENYISAATEVLGAVTETHLLQIQRVQKQYQLGPYTFWQTQYFKQPLSVLNLTRSSLALAPEIQVTRDLRPHVIPSLLINVSLLSNKNSNGLSLVFTDGHENIIGFGLQAPQLISLRERLQGKVCAKNLWRGAVNTAVMVDHRIQVWLVDKHKHLGFKVGDLEV